MGAILDKNSISSLVENASTMGCFLNKKEKKK
jgi:hypothetical protein